MCGQYVPWPEYVTETDRRALYDQSPVAAEWISRLTLFGPPHDYPRNRSIGHRLLDLKRWDAEREVTD